MIQLLIVLVKRLPPKQLLPFALMFFLFMLGMSWITAVYVQKSIKDAPLHELGQLMRPAAATASSRTLPASPGPD
jgi:hypothetical protein